jgi:uncharacterized protein YjiS (DUF1127 family)
MHATTVALHRSWSYPVAKPRPSAWLARAAAALARAYRLRRDTRELLTFSDAMLSDIGLGRGGVEGTVRLGRECS